ncbi:hypothetical protein K438DRAFT_1975788 [Mycena galopus ATCC 62051]|nr:hypothetical protein K438DRAFT_1975788 [Mycena galopus ATCC 62051]
MPVPAELLQRIDSSSDVSIVRLAEAVAIRVPSISGYSAFRLHVLRMSDWLNAQLQALAVATKQPAALSDGWTSDPFVLKPLPDGRLLGCSSSDDKRLVLGWLNVLQWHADAASGSDLHSGACASILLKFSRGFWLHSGFFFLNSSFHFVALNLIVVPTLPDSDYFPNLFIPPYYHISLDYFSSRATCPSVLLPHIYPIEPTQSTIHTHLIPISPLAPSAASSTSPRRTSSPSRTDLISLTGRLVSPDGNIVIPGGDEMVSVADAEEGCSDLHSAPSLPLCPLPALLATITPRHLQKLDYFVADEPRRPQTPPAVEPLMTR